MNVAPVIEVRNLRRRFGKVEAVKDVSFDIEPGQVVGFIGANGAGKTTTMRMMATLELPDEGRVRICGYDTLEFPADVRVKIGWMPDAYGTYDNMSVLEYLDFFARSFGYRKADRVRRVHEVMDFTDLKPLADRPMNKLSKGMGQRLCLGRTLLHDPEVLILDEPAAGLDPKARMEFKQLIRLLAGERKTVFISSHILSELGEMCDTLLFINEGKIIQQGTAESFQHDLAPVIEVQVIGDPTSLLNWIALNPGVALTETTKNGARMRFEDNRPEALAATLRRMIADGVEVTEFHRESRKLEEAFVDILRKI